MVCQSLAGHHKEFIYYYFFFWEQWNTPQKITSLSKLVTDWRWVELGDHGKLIVRGREGGGGGLDGRPVWWMRENTGCGDGLYVTTEERDVSRFQNWTGVDIAGWARTGKEQVWGECVVLDRFRSQGVNLRGFIFRLVDSQIKKEYEHSTSVSCIHAPPPLQLPPGHPTHSLLAYAWNFINWKQNHFLH